MEQEKNFSYEMLFKEIVTNYPGFKSLVEYIREIKPAKRKEWITLVEKSQHGDDDAFNRLIDIYLKRIMGVVYDFSIEYKIDFEEIFSLGIIGFIYSVYNYRFTKQANDPNKIFPFGYYFPNQIKKYLMKSIDAPNNYLVDHSFFASYAKLSTRINKVWLFLGKEGINLEDVSLNREKILKLIIEKLNLKIEEADFLLGCIEYNKCYDELETYYDSEELMDQIYIDMLYDELYDLLSTLKSNEELVLKLRFGLEDGIERTQKEIGKIIERTSGCVSLIEKKALRKLKFPPNKERLEPYYEVLRKKLYK